MASLRIMRKLYNNFKRTMLCDSDLTKFDYKLFPDKKAMQVILLPHTPLISPFVPIVTKKMVQ